MVECRIFDDFGRTDLRIGLSEAKFDEEADFEVRLLPNPPKPCDHNEKQNFGSNFSSRKNFFRRRKMKCRESSETRFPKVWRVYEPCLRDERPFDVSLKNRNS